MLHLNTNIEHYNFYPTLSCSKRSLITLINRHSISTNLPRIRIIHASCLCPLRIRHSPHLGLITPPRKETLILARLPPQFNNQHIRRQPERDGNERQAIHVRRHGEQEHDDADEHTVDQADCLGKAHSMRRAVRMAQGDGGHGEKRNSQTLAVEETDAAAQMVFCAFRVRREELVALRVRHVEG